MKTKFRIREFLEKLPKTDYDKAVKELPVLLEIHPKSFNRLMNVKDTERYEPAAIILVRLASFFNCTTEELYTTPPGRISIEDIYIVDSEHAANQLNLTA